VTTPKFDAASIKPCKPDFSNDQRSGQPISTSGGRLIAVCAPVRALIQLAYLTYANRTYRDFNFYEVPIEPARGWIQSEFYTIEAKAEAPQCKGVMLGQILRDLLEERLQLRNRRVSRVAPIYDLVIARAVLSSSR
jgi:uncharacterized protein (TIGR03435 family)